MQTIKAFLEKKGVVVTVRILGWISIITLVIMTIWFNDIIANNKFLSFALVATSALHAYKKDYKKFSAQKRTIIICIWIIMYLICGYIGFLVNG